MLNTLYVILGIVITTVASTLLITLTKNLRKKVDNELFLQALDVLDDIIYKCVEDTNQTFVNQLKQEGNFDLAAQKAAFEKTYAEVCSILNTKTKALLENNIQNLGSYITNTIESTIVELKA